MKHDAGDDAGADAGVDADDLIQRFFVFSLRAGVSFPHIVLYHLGH